MKLKFSAIKNLLVFIFFIKKEFTKIKIDKYKFRSLIKKFKKNIFLKIDIEGSEYQLLDDIIKYKSRINGLVIEFHSVDLKIFKIDRFLKKLNFKITNIHINNYSKYGKNLIPKVIEMTLEKNPKIIRYKYISESSLNQKNNIYGKEVKYFFK